MAKLDSKVTALDYQTQLNKQITAGDPRDNNGMSPITIAEIMLNHDPACAGFVRSTDGTGPNPTRDTVQRGGGRQAWKDGPKRRNHRGNVAVGGPTGPVPTSCPSHSYLLRKKRTT
ncbi:hypothetical protein NL676_003603 [Syzygium grande]|nr:hypothetical protein NL676_003603 [Syzygium grande]